MQLHTRTLKNGLKLLTIPMANTETVTVMVLVGTGSHYEIRKNVGISHFLEHMFFKGTKKYPDPITLNKQLDAIGAQHNAFTSMEETGYYVKCHKDHFDLALGFVSDILQNSLIPAGEITKEKNVILEEMKMRKDNPRIHIWDMFGSVMFGDQSAGWDTIGTEETLSAVTRKSLVDYWNTHYTSENAMVIVSGNVADEETMKKVERAFTKLRRGKKQKRTSTSARVKAPNIRVLPRETDQVHFMLGFSGFAYEDKDKLASEVLATILGGYMSSRLFDRIRERLGLAYSIRAWHESFPQHGYFAIYAGVPQGKEEKALSETLDELSTVAKKGVSKEEFARAIEHFKGSLAIGLEATDDVAHYVGGQMLYAGKVLLPEAVAKKLDTITRADIQRVAKKMFSAKNAYMTLTGQNIDEKKMRALLKHM